MPELFCPRCDRRLTPDHRCLSRRIFLASLTAAFFPFGELPGGDYLCVRVGSKALGTGYWALGNRCMPIDLLTQWLHRQVGLSGHKIYSGMFMGEWDAMGHPMLSVRAYLYRGERPRKDCPVFEVTPDAMLTIAAKEKHVLPALR